MKARAIGRAVSAWLLIALPFGLGWSAGSVAEPAASVKEAVAAFDALVAAKRPKNELPLLSDPRTAAVLERIWAAATPSSAPTGSVAEVVASGELSSAELHVLDAYVYFPAPSPSPLDFEAIAKRSGPETAGAIAASIAAAARLSAVLERFYTTHAMADPPRDEERIRRLRQPTFGLVFNSQKLMAATTVRREDIARMAAAFRTHGADLALIMSSEERAMIKASFAPLSEKLDAPARRDLDAFVGLIEATPCGRLCEVPM